MATPEPPRRLRPAPAAIDRFDWLAWSIDYRFVREVERLERDGRVKSRGDLEVKLGMRPGDVALIRRGRRTVLATHIAELQRHYNADYKYILFGDRIPGEGEARTIVRPGQGEVRAEQYEPLIYPYGQPAGWRIGPKPEEDARHYPAHPEGKLWQPHPLGPESVRRRYEQYKAEHPELYPLESETRVGKKKAPAVAGRGANYLTKS